MSVNITPTILSGDINLVKKQLDLVKSQSDFKVVQIDVLDGSYSDQVTITPQDLLDYDFSDLELDFHLLTEEPMDYVWELEEYASQLPIRTVFGQLERMSYQEAFLEEVKKQNWQAGLGVDLFTPLSSVTAESWDWIDRLLLMSVEAGDQGRPFNNLVFSKIKEAQSIIRSNGEPVLICVDGGVNQKNLAELKLAKANEVAINSALFKAEDFATAASTLRDLC